jgi:hypothetical protein
MINKLDLIKEYREMFSQDLSDLSKKCEYFILNDLRRRSTFDKVAEIDYSIIEKAIDSEIKNFLNVDEKNIFLMVIEQRYFNPEETENLKCYLYENHFFKDYHSVSKNDIVRDIKMHIVNQSQELYNQIKEELEYYKNKNITIIN